MIDLFKKAGEYVKQNCIADDFILRIHSSDSRKTRFAQNAITQHIDGSNFSANLTVAFGNKTGSASINQIDDVSLKHIIDTAQEIAKLNQPDPEYIPTEGKNELPEFNNFSESTAGLSAEEMVDNVGKCVENAKSKDAVVSGITEKNLWKSYIITKNGFEGYDNFSSFSHSMTLKKDSVETKVSRGMKEYKNFDLEKEIEQLNSQFDNLGKPQKTPPGKYNVILRPAAVENLFGFLYWMMNMRDADEGVNPFTGQVGKQFFGKKFSLKSTLDDASLISPIFGNEGLPAGNTNWVKNGIIENLPTSRYYAKLKKLNPVSPSNFVIGGGSTTEQEMMDSVENGLIINNFWYIRFIDRKKDELTGMTRDGVMYFENGKIKNTTNNFRWNEVLHDITHRILALGPSILKGSYTKVPSMLIKDFNFVDTSSF